jgi:hypothetical protein
MNPHSLLKLHFSGVFQLIPLPGSPRILMLCLIPRCHWNRRSDPFCHCLCRSMYLSCSSNLASTVRSLCSTYTFPHSHEMRCTTGTLISYPPLADIIICRVFLLGLNFCHESLLNLFLPKEFVKIFSHLSQFYISSWKNHRKENRDFIKPENITQNSYNPYYRSLFLILITLLIVPYISVALCLNSYLQDKNCEPNGNNFPWL